MRCPKCRYISFEDHERCRNCGYDFSLAPVEPPLDLPIRQDEVTGPMADLRLAAVQRRRSAAAALTPPDTGIESISARYAAGNFDLPLFNDARDDIPLISGDTPPRAPLSVRRAAPVTPRPRSLDPVREEPELEFVEATESLPTLESMATYTEPADGEQPDARPRSTGVIDTDTLASAGPRLLGALVDAVIVAAIDAGVLHFTLLVCGLTFADLRALPPVPMVAFLLLLNGGYLTMFTAAGGQTIGKMLAGTRVVPSAPSARPQRLPFGTAIVRAAASFVSLLPAGAGFFMALLRADGRALHDAVADTRVIKA